MIARAYGPPTVTKDGVTVAREIELEDKYENVGAQMVRVVASKTSDVAGDGTTTATVLADSIFHEGLKVTTAGGFQRPVQSNNPASNNPLVGTWYLQDTVNGTQIRIGASFDAQGQFAIEMVALNGYGQQSQDSSYGTYSVQGNTLTTNSSDGVEQSHFWFENGMLYVLMKSLGTTLIFQPAS